MRLHTKKLSQNLPHLKRFALSLTGNHDQANDLVQDCVVRAMEKDHMFQPGTNHRKWMFAMMRNIFLDGKRREQTRYRYAGDVRETYETQQSPRQFDRQVLRETLGALDELNENERQAIHLLCVKGMSLAEVSKLKRVPVGTLKSRLSRGRSRLRARLDESSTELKQAA